MRQAFPIKFWKKLGAMVWKMENLNVFNEDNIVVRDMMKKVFFDLGIKPAKGDKCVLF